MIIICSCTACGRKTDSGIIIEDVPLAGGYSIENPVAGNIPDYARTAFDEAIDGIDGKKFNLLACIGEQPAVGNFYFLVQTQGIYPSAKKELHITKVHAESGTNAKVLSDYRFNITDYIENGTIDVTIPETEDDGIHVSRGGSMTKMPQRLATAVSEAFANFDQISLEPLACVGQQVVAGTNYALICRGTSCIDTASEGLFMVVVYCGLQGNAEVLSVCPVNLAEFL